MSHRAIVLDASAYIELAIGSLSEKSKAHQLVMTADLHVPEHFRVETAHSLKNLMRRRKYEKVAEHAFFTVVELNLMVVPFAQIAEQTWAHRHHLSLYDASYLASAIERGLPLVTADRVLADVARQHCEVITPED